MESNKPQPKPRLGIANDQSWRWKGSKDIGKWAIQDKKGDWWFVGGSEFPEKRAKRNCEKRKIKETSGTLAQVTMIVLACVLGVSLALNLILSLRFF
jgi:hypothetical protein